jgi:hypothetical protein
MVTTAQPKMTAAKTLVAMLGTTLTAITTALATVELVLTDDRVDLTEYGTLATAVVSLVGTVYAVWRVPNHVVSPAQHGNEGW